MFKLYKGYLAMTYKRKAVLYFSDEALERGKQLTPMQFLVDFRKLHGDPAGSEKSDLISLKIKPSLLRSFKALANKRDKKY
jgi:hypothetical protein